MPRIIIRTRDEPDPLGNPVDIFPEVKLVRVIAFENSQRRSAASLLPRIVDVLFKIRAATNKRLRESQFPVWAGVSTNSLGLNLLSISVPDPLDHRLFKEFFDEFHTDETYRESGAYLLRDTGGVPIARYLQGKVIIYADPFDVPHEVAALLAKHPDLIECRSWESVPTKKQKSPYDAVRKPSHTSPQLHNLEVWYENHTAMLEFLTSLKSPCGYKRLRTIARDNFGIGVFEESSPEFLKFGCIRLGWLQKDQTASVRILINKYLNDKLKYIVLAHELSHYCLHFEMLLMGQIVEEAAWFDPQVEIFYQSLLHKHAGLISKMELDADELASFFLLPPWMYPMKKLSDDMFEAGQSPSPEELAWRFLQPLFPDSEMQEYSWANWSAMKQKMVNEMADVAFNQHDNSSLYASLLRAALRRERGETAREEVEDLLTQLFEEFVLRLMMLTQPGPGSNPENIERLVATLTDEDQSLKLSELGLNATDFLKEIVPPLNFSGSHPWFPKIPLVPASYNPEGRRDGDWWYLPRGSDSVAGTVTEWLTHKNGYGLVLYRYESWQREFLKRY